MLKRSKFFLHEWAEVGGWARPLLDALSEIQRNTNRSTLSRLLSDDRVLTLYKNGPCESHNDFTRPLVEKGVVCLNRDDFCKVRTHFYNDASTYDRCCDRRVAEIKLRAPGFTESEINRKERSHLTERRRSYPQERLILTVWKSRPECDERSVVFRQAK